MVQHLGGERAFISRHVVGPLAFGPVMGGDLDTAGKRRDDDPGHLILDGEDVLELAVVSLGPDMPVGLRVDELNGDADAIGDLAHASFENVVHIEFTRDLLHLYRLPLVDEGRIARDDEQIAEARQLGDDVLGKAVGEEFLLRIAAHIGEWENGDRRLPGRGHAGRGPLFGFRDQFRIELHFEDTDGTGNVLDGLIAQILEHDVVEAISDLIAYRARHANATGLGEHLEARRHIDAVAEDVLVLDDHVTQIDPDTELDPARRRHIGIPPCHSPLNLGGADHRIDHALEFDQHPVARCLDDPPSILGDGGIDELEPMGFQASKRPILVCLHKPAVSDHVGGEDRSEPALWSWLFDARASPLAAILMPAYSPPRGRQAELGLNTADAPR